MYFHAWCHFLFKARNIEYKDPIQEEWEKFQREIKDAEGESAAIIAEDQEESTIERKRDRIDEQMENFSKWVTCWNNNFILIFVEETGNEYSNLIMKFGHNLLEKYV